MDLGEATSAFRKLVDSKIEQKVLALQEAEKEEKQFEGTFLSIMRARDMHAQDNAAAGERANVRETVVDAKQIPSFRELTHLPTEQLSLKTTAYEKVLDAGGS